MYSGQDDDSEIQVEVRSATPTTTASRRSLIGPPIPVMQHLDPRRVPQGTSLAPETGDAAHDPQTPSFVLPLWAVIGTASVGLLCFLDSARGAAPEEAFVWLVAVASVASLQSWAGMLYTYIRFVDQFARRPRVSLKAGRWHKGTIYAEQENLRRLQMSPYDRHAKRAIRDIEFIKSHRYWGQPYVRCWLPSNTRASY